MVTLSKMLYVRDVGKVDSEDILPKRADSSFKALVD